MKIKPLIIVRWVLTVIMLVLMWRGNKFCLYYFVTGMVVVSEVMNLSLGEIAKILKGLHG